AKNRGGIIVFGDREANRAGRGQAKRLGAASADHQPRRRGPTQLPVGREPLIGHPVDRQSQGGVVRAGNQNRPSGTKFGEPALNGNMIGYPEQAQTTSILAVAHDRLISPSFNQLKQCKLACCSLNRHSSNTHGFTIYLFLSLRRSWHDEDLSPETSHA